MAKKKKITSEDFDQKFDSGQDITEHLELDTATRGVLVDFPTWMIEDMDKEAKRLGVPRQSLIKMWIGQRLDLKRAKTKKGA